MPREPEESWSWKVRAGVTITVLVVVVLGVAFHGSSAVTRMAPPPRRHPSTQLASVHHVSTIGDLSDGARRVMQQVEAEVEAEMTQEAAVPMQHLDLMMVLLQGEPKSGTTWMELVVNDMIAK